MLLNVKLKKYICNDACESAVCGKGVFLRCEYERKRKKKDKKAVPKGRKRERERVQSVRTLSSPILSPLTILPHLEE